MDINKINSIVADSLGINLGEIKEEANFFEDYNCDQIEVNDMMLKINNELQVQIPENEFQALQTVSDLYLILEEYSDEV